MFGHLIWRPLLATDGLPGLVTDVLGTGDGTRVTCLPHPAARWSDGRQLTAAGIAAAVNELADQHRDGLLDASASVDANGRLTIVSRRLHADRLLRAIRPARADDQAIGTGPYRILEHDQDLGLRLGLVDHWWGAAPDGLPAAIDVVAVEEPAEAAMLHREGVLDVVGEPDLVLAQQALRAPVGCPDRSVVYQIGRSIQLLAFNLRHPVGADTAARRRAHTAVDRAVIASRYAELATPAGSLLGAGQRRPVTADPAPGGAPIRLRLTYNRENPVRAAVVGGIGRDLAGTGISVHPDPRSWTEIGAALAAQAFETVLLTWSVDEPEALWHLWHSRGARPYGDNLTGLADPAVDAVLDRLVGDRLPLQRQLAPVAELAAALDREIPAVPLTTHPELLVASVNAPVRLLYGRRSPAAPAEITGVATHAGSDKGA